MSRTFDLYFHKVYELDIPKNSFNINKKYVDVPCIFQIWMRKDVKRILPPTLIPRGYSFVKKNQTPTISFRRVGINAGVISYEIENKSIESHYFIKIENMNDIIFNKLKELTFEFNNTVGPRSIGKQELIEQFNNAL